MNRFLLITIAIALASCTKQGTTVSEWRGPNRTGIYQETNLLKEWPENGPRQLWEVTAIGNGYGSAVVANDKLLVMGTKDSASVLFAFDLNGKALFETEVGDEWVVNFPGSRGTPTVAGNFAYTITGKGDLSCVDLRSGKIEWEKNFVTDFGGESPRFGYAESALVVGDKLFCMPGGKDNNVVCINRLTGSMIWSSKAKGERSAYNSMALVTVGKRNILAAFSAYHLLGIDAETGQLLWSHEQLNTPKEEREPGKGDTHGNTIVFDNNILYYIEGDGNGSVALEVSPDGLSVKQLWNNAMVDNYMGGFVKNGDYLYSCAYSKSTLVKIDARTGVVTDSLSIGRGALIMADQKLFYYNQKGEVHMIDIESGNMKVVSSFTVNKGDKEHFAHPVIHKGVLYIRHGNYLGAYQIAE